MVKRHDVVLVDAQLKLEKDVKLAIFLTRSKYSSNSNTILKNLTKGISKQNEFISYEEARIGQEGNAI